MVRAVKKGSTDQSVVIRIVDSTDFSPETGVVYNTAGIDLWYRREGATKTSITEATLAALDTAHSDGGIIHIGDGYYRLDLPDAAVATGANGVMVGGTVTGMHVIGCYVPLTAHDPVDILASAYESTETFGQFLRLARAILMGVTSGQSTATGLFKAKDGTTTRITATTDANGNRTGMTIDAAD